jgi:Tfp pilus tip-associated adhesin PilY1
MAKLNFGGVEENVVTRDEFPLAKAQEVLKNEVVAVIGYGVQGPGQALNQKENGIHVIVGQRKNSKSWEKAVAANRCRSNCYVAYCQEVPDTGEGALFFSWIWHYL